MNSLVLSAAMRREMPLWVRYASATALIAAGGLGVRMLDAHGIAAPYLLLIPIVMLVSLTLDRGSGFYAAVLASLAYLALADGPGGGWQRPVESWRMAALTGFILFAGTTGLAAILIEELYRCLCAARNADRDKELLLREASHRIKNNLQTIISLLRLQKRGAAATDGTREALETALARINVIATIHGRLVGNALSEQVDMGQFVVSLCNDLRKSAIGERPIALSVEAGAAPIDCSRAASAGLIVNELIANAIEHAFPDGRAGTIFITLGRSGDDYVFEVSDDGVGGAASALPGLGHTLMQLLARQLGGAMEWIEGPGTRRRLRFPVAGATPRR